MKVIAILFLVAMGYPAFGQLQLLQHDVPLTNGDTLQQVYAGEEMPIILYTDLVAENGGMAAQNVLVRVDQSAMYPGTQVQLCWAGYCYGPLYTETPDAEYLAAGSTTGFQAKYFPNDYNHGISDITYTFIDPAFPADSAWITVHYEMHSTLGISELAALSWDYSPEGIRFETPVSGSVVDASGRRLTVISRQQEWALPANQLLFIQPDNSRFIRYFRYAP